MSQRSGTGANVGVSGALRDPGGVILAGGLARRMGGGDKGARLLGGQPVLARVIARLAPQVGPLALNANGEAARFSAFGLPVLPDSVPGHPGPLAGILAAMDWGAAQGLEQVVTAAADTPFLPCDLVTGLCRTATQTGARIVLAADQADGVERCHPVFGLWPVDLAAELRAALADGVRKVAFWAGTQGAVTAVFGGHGFFNINTPEDLEQAEALLLAGEP